MWSQGLDRYLKALLYTHTEFSLTYFSLGRWVYVDFTLPLKRI